MRPISEVAAASMPDHARMAVNPKRIVVGFDGTEGARRALDAAAELMGYGSTMTVVRVSGEGARDELDPLELARDVLLGRLITARYEKRLGDAADEIVGIARDLDADVIVIGRRGPRERNGAGPGSVSADVVRRASCDVLVVAG
jgi:nucleotide-binding universal stress UspA family protein